MQGESHAQPLQSMRGACYGVEMSVMLQIRDLPDEVHRTLKARAAAAGMSLSEFARQILARAASRPTPEELSRQIEARGRVDLPEPSHVTVRKIRESGE